MAGAKKGGLTKEDIEGLKGLYDVLDNFHKDIKAKAEAANSKETLLVRSYFEKYLAKATADLSAIDARIRRGEMALFRRDTKALRGESDQEETES